MLSSPIVAVVQGVAPMERDGDVGCEAGRDGLHHDDEGDIDDTSSR